MPIRKSTVLPILIGLAGLLYGSYCYVDDQAFLARAIKTQARIDTVKDNDVTEVVQPTRGVLSGTRIYHDHACRYGVSFETTGEKVVTNIELVRIGMQDCKFSGSYIPVMYDPKSPERIIDTTDYGQILPVGGMWFIAGVSFILVGLADWLKYKLATRPTS